MSPNASRPRVFLHLDHGRGEAAWRRAFEGGKVFTSTPYGYEEAAGNVELQYSVDVPEGRVRRFVRRGALYVLGFDLLHAWTNRRHLREADAVWAHTEHEHLAACLLMRLRVVPRRPVVAQSVWLWDEWAGWSRARRAATRWLLDVAAQHTTLSTDNARVGTQVLGRPVLTVPFGVELAMDLTPLRDVPADGPINVLSLGSDRHRDWPLLLEAARLDPRLNVKVLSRRRAAHPPGSEEVANYAVESVSNVAGIREAYAWADVVVVPLRPNRHASGLTVAFESILAGRPLVITRVGGIDDYYGDDVHYTAVGDAAGLAAAAVEAATDPGRTGRARRARDAITTRGLLITDYAARHVLLTRALLEQGRVSDEVAQRVSAFSSVTSEPGARG